MTSWFSFCPRLDDANHRGSASITELTETIPTFLEMLKCIPDCGPGSHAEFSEAGRGYGRSGGGQCG